MGKHESIDADQAPADAKPAPADAGLATLIPGDGPAAEEAMKNAMAAIEQLKLEIPKCEPQTIEIAKVEAPEMTPPKPDPAGSEQTAQTEQSASAENGASPEPTIEELIPGHRRPRWRITPFALMAASLGGAAAFGAMIGALVATGIARPTPVASIAGPRVGIDDINALKEQVVQARVDLAALKANIDAGHRSANQQFTKIGERVERLERVQAEPVARLTKAVESLDRWERRADANAKDITGSLTPPQPVGTPGKPGGVEGWVVREVRRGTAYIEGRMGIIEVDQGDIVPGLGRVEAIRKQDGRWVVVTSRGTIHQAR